jgi:hypothetical protein
MWIYERSLKQQRSFLNFLLLQKQKKNLQIVCFYAMIVKTSSQNFTFYAEGISEEVIFNALKYEAHLNNT